MSLFRPKPNPIAVAIKGIEEQFRLCVAIQRAQLETSDANLAVAKASLDWFKSRSCGGITKQDLEEMEKRIMSRFSEYAAAQKAYNEAQATAIDDLGVSVGELTTATTGLAGDVEGLNKKIEDLQNSGGGMTPEDEATLNDLQTAGAALQERLTTAAAAAKAASAGLKALDEKTPPVIPVP